MTENYPDQVIIHMDELGMDDQNRLFCWKESSVRYYTRTNLIQVSYYSITVGNRQFCMRERTPQEDVLEEVSKHTKEIKTERYSACNQMMWKLALVGMGV